MGVQIIEINTFPRKRISFSLLFSFSFSRASDSRDREIEVGIDVSLNEELHETEKEIREKRRCWWGRTHPWKACNLSPWRPGKVFPPELFTDIVPGQTMSRLEGKFRLTRIRIEDNESHSWSLFDGSSQNWTRRNFGRRLRLYTRFLWFTLIE